jgi:hypothetical protein
VIAYSTIASMSASSRAFPGASRIIRQGGFSAEQTYHAYHALDSHIAGFTLWEVNLDIDPETLPVLASKFVVALPSDEYPYVIEHVHEHLKERHPGEEGEFAFGLDLILDGLDRLRNGS